MPTTVFLQFFKKFEQSEKDVANFVSLSGKTEKKTASSKFLNAIFNTLNVS
jgi:hypothetical protein